MKKDITLSEFLSIIRNNEIDKLEKIERVYNIDVIVDGNLWYGQQITICDNYKQKDDKEDVFDMYYYFSKNPDNDTQEERNYLFNVIVDNGWLEEYNSKYSNEFGL